MNILNSQDIISLIAEKNKITEEQANSFLDALIKAIENKIVKDGEVDIKGLGTFKLIQEIDNFQSDKKQAPQEVAFYPTHSLKRSVNSPFAHFEKTLLHDGVSFDTLELANSINKKEKEEYTINELSSATISDFDDKEKLEDMESLSPQNDSVEDIDIHHNRRLDEEKNSTKKSRNRSFIWSISILLLIGISFSFHHYVSSKKRNRKNSANNLLENISSSLIPSLPAKEIEKKSLVEKEKKNDTIIIMSDNTLRLIALERFGHREFWIYIYLKNKNRIKNPNLIPIGIQLILPDKQEFDMDATNQNHILKAKRLGDKELKKH